MTTITRNGGRDLVEHKHHNNHKKLMKESGTSQKSQQKPEMGEGI